MERGAGALAERAAHPGGRWAVAAAGLVLATAAYLVATVRLETPVAEDAAILMRYARHVAAGEGFVWNPGEVPVDGATDWLAAVVLAGLYAVGVPLMTAPRLLAGAAHVATVALVAVIARRTCGAPVIVTLASAATVAVGPGRAYVEAGFLTPVFALAALATWWAIVDAARAPDRRQAAWFAAGALVSGLVRPEGVILAAVMLLAAAIVLTPADWRRFTWATAWAFATGGAAFLLWRWAYFGRVLPLPFLKKGGGALHWDGLQFAAIGVVTILGWLLPAMPLGWRRGRGGRWLGALAVVVGGFTAIWVLLSSEMNYVWRFQYALMPIVAATWWAAAAETGADLRRAWPSLAAASRRAVALMAALAVAAALALQHRRYDAISLADGRLEAARLLRAHGSGGQTLVTTEAGLLPLVSDWRSVDAWGLNDPAIVAAGGITPSHLAARRPDVIVFHSYYTPLTPWESRPSGDDWSAMVATLHGYAACRGYVLAAAFAPDLREAHYYYVSPGWPAHASFTEALRTQPYPWWAGGADSRNLAALEPPPPDVICAQIR